MPVDYPWRENILQHHARYKQRFDMHVRTSIGVIQSCGQRGDWKENLKASLQHSRKKSTEPPVIKILDVLAVASAYWTVDMYAAGSLHDDSEVEDLPLKKPHAAQIVTIFRLLVWFLSPFTSLIPHPLCDPPCRD